jgi:predicted nucleotidyltransferase
MQAYKEKEYLEEGIINTLKYFQIFKFPLYLEEIHRFLNIGISTTDLLFHLKMMKNKGVIFTCDDLYMLYEDPLLATRRIRGAIEAQIKMEDAKKVASLIWKFPFVQGVFISGSLSKGYADKNSDIDFFIVTKTNRLWISRTILHLYKKLTFLKNRQHAFCMNYFIDESRLNIEEQNLFTATELATLIPVCNADVYREFINNNRYWLVNIYPNIKWTFDQVTINQKVLLKNISEAVINLFMPKYLNRLLMQITDKWWRYKWKRKNYQMQDYDIAMKTRWYVSKNHPANYQKKVLKKLEEIKYHNTFDLNV